MLILVEVSVSAIVVAVVVFINIIIFIVTVVVVVLLLNEIKIRDQGLPEFEEDPFLVCPPSVLFELFTHVIDSRADLKSWPQFDGHGRHQMVGLQQHECLAVDLLEQEILHVVRTSRQSFDEVAHLLHAPLQRIRAFEESLHIDLVLGLQVCGIT